MLARRTRAHTRKQVIDVAAHDAERSLADGLIFAAGSASRMRSSASRSTSVDVKILDQQSGMPGSLHIKLRSADAGVNLGVPDAGYPALTPSGSFSFAPHLRSPRFALENAHILPRTATPQT